ncbi:unnamed protein product, partial [Choristocarpus tenellus]
FNIPELPSGNVLVLNILSTWGDPYYVGLMGLDVFDGSGHRPCETQSLSQYLFCYCGCPHKRTVDNLLDGHNHTCDDLHAWLAPFARGSDHLVVLEFPEDVVISMIRIWNYNKSRIHSYRGARYVEISLGGRNIFRGEIRRATGAVIDVESSSECILFTTNDTILQ